MLVTKKFAGVTSEENLRNPSFADNKAYMEVERPGFETQGTHYHMSKTTLSVTKHE